MLEDELKSLRRQKVIPAPNPRQQFEADDRVEPWELFLLWGGAAVHVARGLKLQLSQVLRDLHLVNGRVSRFGDSSYESPFWKLAWLSDDS